MMKNKFLILFILTSLIQVSAQTDDIILTKELFNPDNESFKTIISKGHIFVDIKSNNQSQKLELYHIEENPPYCKKINKDKWELFAPANMPRPVYLKFKVRCQDRHLGLNNNGEIVGSSLMSNDTLRGNQEATWVEEEKKNSTITSKPITAISVEKTPHNGIQEIKPIKIEAAINSGNCEIALKKCIKECFKNQNYAIKDFAIPENLITPNCNLLEGKLPIEIPVVETLGDYIMIFKIIELRILADNQVLLTGEIITEPENLPAIIANQQK